MAIASVLASAALLVACGGDSSSTDGADSGESTTVAETTNSPPPRSGERPNAWNRVEPGLRRQILEFGEQGSQAELERAAAVVSDYLVAVANHQPSKICSHLSKELRGTTALIGRQGGKGNCIRGAEKLANLSTSDEAGYPGDIEPNLLRRHGTRVFVVYTDHYGDLFAMLMRPEGGAWKVQGFSPKRLT